MGSVAALALTLALSLEAQDPKAVPRCSLQGKYVARHPDFGNCQITLQGDLRYKVECGDQTQLAGKALLVEGRLLLAGGLTGLHPAERARALETFRRIFQQEHYREHGFFPLVNESSEEAPTSLEPLSWGPRLYLLSPDDMAPFCRAVAEGTEPRRTPAGRFFLRRGDERKVIPTEDRPSLCKMLEQAR
jgi:hypothetical protein